MVIKVRNAFLIAALLAMKAHAAGKTSITEAGAKNLGSSLAYIALCEMAQHSPSGTLAGLMSELRLGLTEEGWGRVRTQYQKSLHEKKQYSIAYDRWIPFTVSAKDCKSLEDAIPLVKSAVRHGRK